ESHMASIVYAMETLQVFRENSVVTVTINQPEKKNAINSAMWDGLAEIFREIASRADDRVVVVTGAGNDFCSGADLSGRGGNAAAAAGASAGAQNQVHHLAAMRRVNDACIALQRLPQPTIAKVRGVAVGAGCNLALGCDLVVASSTARFSEIFARRGLSLDFGGSWLLPRRIGMHRAKELALLAEIISANDALEMGLINRVLPDGEVDAFVDNWARKLAAGPPIALAQTKRLLNNSLNVTLEEALDDEAAAQTINFATSDTAEAMRAFIEKREPKFTGR
ncbi:MAG: enoyl-CoA hydratase, partial [Ilumatobacteraceae bacterium]|nr:enoyl-CoA hydratase [Ilumatobacteraceae bacterium]